jgi:hypothetical protein
LGRIGAKEGLEKLMEGITGRERWENDRIQL